MGRQDGGENSKKKTQFSPLDPYTVLKLLPWTVINWLFWSAGFYFLILSLTETQIPPTAGLSFALATNIGILAIISPGGLGVREAVLIAYLNFIGLSLAEATTISVASRLWFLIGEAMLFAAGLISHKYKKLIEP
ncbi:MAG: lysylphosphatidylglycerol synthase domain-containing protein [Balneolales bacterium]